MNPAIDQSKEITPSTADAADASPRHNILLGIPCGSRSIDPMILQAMARAERSRHCVSLAIQVTSALTYNFNELWCMALNARKTHSITHFAMLHSDIVPQDDDWIDRLAATLDAPLPLSAASAARTPDRRKSLRPLIASVVMPLKDGRGLSSVALDTHRWRPRRLTMSEIAKLPDVFDNKTLASHQHRGIVGVPTGPLLFNTGLWIADIRGQWAERVCFDISNRVMKLNDEFVCDFEPEDWKFSRWAYQNQIPYVVTKAVRAEHIGNFAFGNGDVWGQPNDEKNIAAATEHP